MPRGNGIFHKKDLNERVFIFFHSSLFITQYFLFYVVTSMS